MFCLDNFDFYSFELFERHESLFMYAARSTSQHLIVYIVIEFIKSVTVLLSIDWIPQNMVLSIMINDDITLDASSNVKRYEHEKLFQSTKYL